MKGFAFHCHHEVLAEWVTNYDERVEYIKEHKPQEEQELRLRLFKMIPEDRLPAELFTAWEALGKAWEAYDKAWEVYDKAGEAYNKAREVYDKAREALDKAWEVYNKAGEAYNKAREVYNKAREAYNKTRKALDKAGEAYDWENLHKELCPDCTWDGKTIFPKEE